MEMMGRRICPEIAGKHQFKGRPLSLAVGDVVIIQSDDLNRGEWPLGFVHELYKGEGDIVHGTVSATPLPRGAEL